MVACVFKCMWQRKSLFLGGINIICGYNFGFFWHDLKHAFKHVKWFFSDMQWPCGSCLWLKAHILTANKFLHYKLTALSPQWADAFCQKKPCACFLCTALTQAHLRARGAVILWTTHWGLEAAGLNDLCDFPKRTCRHSLAFCWESSIMQGNCSRWGGR